MPMPTLPFAIVLLTASLFAQEPPTRGGPGGLPGGFPGGGPGGPMQRTELKLVERFDADGNQRLDRQERQAARKWLAENRPQGRGRGGPGGAPGGMGMPPGGMGGRGGMGRPAGSPGPQLQPDEVPTFADRPLYDTTVLRTIFLQFDGDDWEQELADFKDTDVEVPAKLVMDGIELDDVGVQFRGNSSYMMIPAGSKRSFGVSVDAFHDQKLLGYKTLNLLNCNDDPSFLHEAIASWVGNRYAAVPKSNLVRVVVNGECWGVYANTQQFNKDFLAEAYGTRKGARWKVPANFSGSGGLRWLGEDQGAYRRFYEAKGEVSEGQWQRLVELCRELEELDDELLARDLPDILDIDAALWFLALDNALLDGDGYLSRGSDYALYLDPGNVFHVLPYDNNEVLHVGGPGGPGGPGGFGGRGGADRPGAAPGGAAPPGTGPGGGRRGGPGAPANPNQGALAGADNAQRPLLRRLLANPAWRQRYLAFLRTIATDAFDWQNLGGFVQQSHALIRDAVLADTRKLFGNEAFLGSVADLQRVVELRRNALRNDPLIAGEWPDVQVAAATEEADGEQRRWAVTVTTKQGSAPAKAARLWLQTEPFGRFSAMPMEPAGDGVFRARSAPLAVGTAIRWYVEVEAADGRVAFAPRGASSGALRHDVGGAAAKKAKDKTKAKAGGAGGTDGAKGGGNKGAGR